MLREANQAVSSVHGRITLHTFWELIFDFIPNFCYNSTTDRCVDVHVHLLCVCTLWSIFCFSFVRFVRSSLPHDQSEREAPPKGQSAVTLLYGSRSLRDAFVAIFNLYEGFCGPTHFRALGSLLGYQGIAMLLEELMNVVDNQVLPHLFTCTVRHHCSQPQIQNSLLPFVTALMQGMPAKCKLPLYQYGSKGTHSQPGVEKCTLFLFIRCAGILLGSIGSCYWLQGLAYWRVSGIQRVWERRSLLLVAWESPGVLVCCVSLVVETTIHFLGSRRGQRLASSIYFPEPIPTTFCERWASCVMGTTNLTEVNIPSQRIKVWRQLCSRWISSMLHCTLFPWSTSMALLNKQKMPKILNCSLERGYAGHLACLRWYCGKSNLFWKRIRWVDKNFDGLLKMVDCVCVCIRYGKVVILLMVWWASMSARNSIDYGVHSSLPSACLFPRTKCLLSKPHREGR